MCPHCVNVESPDVASLRLNLNDGLAVLTRRIVEATLELEGGNKLRAAARLQVSPRTMQRYVASGRARMPVITAR
jgi:DNA-binding NtrC family response regulator